MKTGIRVTFTEVETTTEENEGILYLDEERTSFLEFEGSFTDAFRLIKVLYAVNRDSGEKYTLINCTFWQITSGICRFLINEIYSGGHLVKATEPAYNYADAAITGLTNWINHPRVKPKITFSIHEPSTIALQEAFVVKFPINSDLILEINEFYGESFTKNEMVLRNLSRIRFFSTKLFSRLEAFKHIKAFAQILSLFTDNIPHTTDFVLRDQNNEYIEQIAIKKPKEPGDNDALLTYDLFEQDFPSMLKYFYLNRNKFEQVIDLLHESLLNKTAEISFLNLTTAFEVFHKSFHENNNETLREQVSTELKKANLLKKNPKKWTQIMRYHHLFTLVEEIDFFNQNFPNRQKTLELLTESRNYYTHYGQKKGDIWSPNNLVFVNKSLMQLLKGVILRELNLPNNLINRLLNNRFAFFYQDFESNEYSLQFTGNKTSVTTM